jgi:hypothetical protein
MELVCSVARRWYLSVVMPSDPTGLPSGWCFVRSEKYVEYNVPVLPWVSGGGTGAWRVVIAGVWCALAIGSMVCVKIVRVSSL